MVKDIVYLDSNATTCVDPEVVEAMLPFLTDHFHNPSSGYRAAKVVRQALDKARAQVAELIGAQPEEIVFTGCGTESNNMALESLSALRGEGRMVTSNIEHSAVLRVCESLEDRGFGQHYKVGVDEGGQLKMEMWEAALSKDKVAFASLMWANNETGIVQPVAEALESARAAGVPFHTDAIQAVGKTQVDVREVPVDFLSLSGHKLHAPKGVGALYVRSGLRLLPLLKGGGQEAGYRSGTENVAGIVGLGKAAELAKQYLEEGEQNVEALRNYLETRLFGGLEGLQVNGERGVRLGNTLHVSFKDCEAAGLLVLLDQAGVACSSGSACMTGKQRPSHVQVAMGFTEERAKSSLRLSLSRFTTAEEVERGADAIIATVKKVRSVQGGGVGPVVVYSNDQS